MSEPLASLSVDPEGSIPTAEVGVSSRSEPKPRVVSLDVARAVALVGVFVQNYVVVLNLGGLRSKPWSERFHGFLARLVDLQQGVLTTRFAASLVTIFGIGLTMLSTSKSFTPWIAVRRGLALFVAGMWFNTVWPGTILPFYGMYLILASAVTRIKRSAWLLVGALIITALTFGSRAWIFEKTYGQPSRLFEGDLSWLTMREASGRIGLSNPRGFVGSMLFWGAHPLLPWLAFVLVGMWVGRTAWHTTKVQTRMMAVGLAMLASGYGLSSVMTRTVEGRWRWAWTTTLSSPRFETPIKYDAPLYVVVTVGSSLAGIGLVLWLATKFRSASLVRWLGRAGTMTLTLYVMHGIPPAVMLRWFKPRPLFGVGWAFLTALCGWILAMFIGSWWVKRFRMGPLEWLLRKVGG